VDKEEQAFQDKL